MTLFLNVFLGLSLAAAPLILGEPKDHALEKRPADLIMALEFSSGDQSIISVRADGLVQEWNLKTGTARELGKTHSESLNPRLGIMVPGTNAWILMNKGAYRRAAVAKNLVAMVRGEKSIQIWELEPELKLRKTREASSPIRNGLALSADGRWLAAACGVYKPGKGHFTSIEIWDLSSDAPSRQIEDQDNGLILGMWNIIFSPDSWLLAVDTQRKNQGGVRVWNISSLEIVASWENLNTYWVRALAFRPDGKALAMGDEKGHLQVWSLEKKLLSDVEGLGIVQSLAFSHDGARLAAGLWDSTIRLW